MRTRRTTRRFLTLSIPALLTAHAVGLGAPQAHAQTIAQMPVQPGQNVLEGYSGVVFHGVETGRNLNVSTAPRTPVHSEFGTKGHRAISTGLSYATSHDSTDYQAYVTWHWFLDDRFEFNLSAGAWYFDQDALAGSSGSAEYGFNPSFNFRLHFFAPKEGYWDEQWSFYAELGIGVLYATDEVPEGGSQFNFTPRAGGGITAPLTDSGMRLDVGVSWHHISNASQFGTGDNPDRDGVRVYAGLMFPY